MKVYYRGAGGGGTTTTTKNGPWQQLTISVYFFSFVEREIKTDNMAFVEKKLHNRVESPNKGHFGTNINSSVLSTVWRVSSIKRFQLHHIDREVKIWGFSFVHYREIFNTVSLIRSVC